PVLPAPLLLLLSPCLRNHLLLHFSLFVLAFLLPFPPRDLYSFPTRRSSDLAFGLERLVITLGDGHGITLNKNGPNKTQIAAVYRSEEHTSELQSRFDLVCRLLLERKKLHFLGLLPQRVHPENKTTASLILQS